MSSIYNYLGQDIVKVQERIFLDNMVIDYAHDEDASTNYTAIRVFKKKLDGTLQYPFVYAPAGAGSGTMSTYDMTVRDGWMLAINAGLFNTTNNVPDGFVIQNSTIIQGTPATRHVGVFPLTIDSNGDLFYDAPDATASEMISSGIVSAVCGFYPIMVNYESDPALYNWANNYNVRSQRQIIGQLGGGDYMIITCEGRGYDNSPGWTIAEAVAICTKYGLKFAYNLDGGGSTETMLLQKPLNTIYERTTGRIVPTYIVFNGTNTFSVPNNV